MMVRSVLVVACAGWLLVVASLPQNPAPHRHARHMSRFASLDGFLVRMDTAEKAYNARRRDLRPEHAAAAMRTLNVPAFPSQSNSGQHFPATATQTPPTSNLPQHDSYEEDFDDDLDEPEEEEEVAGKQQPENHVNNGGGSSGVQGVEAGSYSGWKWQYLTNRTVIDELRARRPISSRPLKHSLPRSKSEAELRFAVDHAVLMNREGACRVPRPRLVHVRDEYPAAGKAYFPHCTLLHRCADDTGCCRSDTLACRPSRLQPVELYFYTLGGTEAGIRGPTVVERLVFYNHTECHCVDRMSAAANSGGGSGGHSSSSSLSSSGSSYPITSGNNAGKFRPSHSSGLLRPENIRAPVKPSCKCTSQYTARQLADGTCTCDCFDKQKECLRAKKGKDVFTHSDRLCIEKDECVIPSCEFGAFLRHAGRCPKKREKFAAWLGWQDDEC